MNRKLRKPTAAEKRKFLKGDKGDRGEAIKGEAGKDAPAIDGTKISETGTLVLTLEGGFEIDTGMFLPKDGKDGVGLADLRLEPSGDLIAFFTDETQKTIGNIIAPKGDKGDKGRPGDNGRGIAKTFVSDEGFLITRYTDGKEEISGKVRPEFDYGRIKAQDGEDGEDGKDGRGIKSSTIDDDGNLVFTYSDDEEEVAGQVVGRDGRSLDDIDIDGKSGDLTFTFDDGTKKVLRFLKLFRSLPKLFSGGGAFRPSQQPVQSIGYKTDTFPITNPADKTFTLTYAPIDGSIVFSYNGQIIYENIDWTRSGNVITLDPGCVITTDDVFSATYARNI